PLAMCARVSFSSAAKWKYVKIVCPFRIRFHSTSIGSFTFIIMSACFQTESASGAIDAPAFTYRSSAKPLPSPADFSTSTVWPLATRDSAPAGTSATRFSFVLISFGTPMSMARDCSVRVCLKIGFFRNFRETWGKVQRRLRPLDREAGPGRGEGYAHEGAETARTRRTRQDKTTSLL